MLYIFFVPIDPQRVKSMSCLPKTTIGSLIFSITEIIMFYPSRVKYRISVLKGALRILILFKRVKIVSMNPRDYPQGLIIRLMFPKGF